MIMKKVLLSFAFIFFILGVLKAQQINYAEYFFDADPGIGKAKNMGLSVSADTVNFTTNISSIGLTSGFHTLYIRFRSSDSVWSMPEARLLYISDTNKIVYPIQTVNEPLIKGEFFFDSDTGIGNATPIFFSTYSDTINIMKNISTVGLLSGFHYLYFRVQDSLGIWSMPENRLLFVSDTTLNHTNYTVKTSPNLTAIQYQFDTISNPIFTLIISPLDTLNVLTSIRTVGLSQGAHKLLVSIVDSLGFVSFMEPLSFTICNSLPNSPTTNANTSVFVYNGGSTSFSATAPSGTSIFWRGPNGFTSNNSTINLTNINASKLGDYAAYAVSGNTKCDTSFALVFNVSLAPVPINVKVFLEGLYIGNNALTPALFNADGRTSTSLSDIINIDLRDTIYPFAKLYNKAGIVNTNGSLTVNFPNQISGRPYYIVVRHRNSIETWSNVPILINLLINSFDFTNASNKAFGDNLKNINGVYAIYSGDINQDGAIDFNDYPSLDISSSNGDLGYLNTDLNGDASVDFNDYPIIDLNSSLGIISVTP